MTSIQFYTPMAYCIKRETIFVARISGLGSRRSVKKSKIEIRNLFAVLSA